MGLLLPFERVTWKFQELAKRTLSLRLVSGDPACVPLRVIRQVSVLFDEQSVGRAHCTLQVGGWEGQIQCQVCHRVHEA